MENIFHRVSIRKFSNQPVEKEKIEQILRAAMQAPSACNQQPWEFYVVEDKEIDEKIEELSIREIGKYLIVAEELEWVDNYIGDDKVFYNYDKNLLEELSYKFEDSVFRLINEELLYDNNLHTYPDDLEDGVIV